MKHKQGTWKITRKMKLFNVWVSRSFRWSKSSVIYLKNEWWRAFEQVYFIHQKEAKRDLIWGINWGGGGEETEMLYQKSFSFGLKSIFHDL